MVSSRAVVRESSREHFTFRGNLRETRHGWLRLTPAYSVNLVRELLAERARPELPVLDPFSGTGTTLLACAEAGIACTAVDLNPFLVWLARAKTARYSAQTLVEARRRVRAMAQAASRTTLRTPWAPPLHQIEKWWPKPVLEALGRAFESMSRGDSPTKVMDLCKLSFCRALIECAGVSFRHQSMSFRASDKSAASSVSTALETAFEAISKAAREPLPGARGQVKLGDSRRIDELMPQASFGAVITSPPYVNRMSYVRELRPYMYWLGFLRERSDAGELDWRAIGGTWGIATSNLGSWEPEQVSPSKKLSRLCRAIAKKSPILSRYVERYFHDMVAHARGLFPVVARGGELRYVIGNSKFYDVVLPAEELFVELFEEVGFSECKSERLRKRTSKPELYEFLISARKL
jgi:hypothetical protein